MYCCPIRWMYSITKFPGWTPVTELQLAVILCVSLYDRGYRINMTRTFSSSQISGNLQFICFNLGIYSSCILLYNGNWRRTWGTFSDTSGLHAQFEDFAVCAVCNSSLVKYKVCTAIHPANNGCLFNCNRV